MGPMVLFRSIGRGDHSTTLSGKRRGAAGGKDEGPLNTADSRHHVYSDSNNSALITSLAYAMM